MLMCGSANSVIIKIKKQFSFCLRQRRFDQRVTELKSFWTLVENCSLLESRYKARKLVSSENILKLCT